MTSVFISYSRKDSAFANKLSGDLTKNNIDNWLDTRDIPAGRQWDNSIEQGIRDCTHFVVILSPHSVASENVKDEIGFAIGERKEIVPVLFKDCNPPLRIQRLQQSDFRRSYEDGFNRLLEALGQSISSRPAPQTFSSVNWKIIVPTTVFILILSAALLWQIPIKSGTKKTPTSSITIEPSVTKISTSTPSQTPIHTKPPSETPSPTNTATQTPTLTLESITESTPVIQADCISSKIWSYYPLTEIATDGCWVFENREFSPQENGVLITKQTGSNSGEQQRGFYMWLEKDVDIEFTIMLEEFESSAQSTGYTDKSNLTFGIVEGDPFKYYNGIYLYFYAAKPGSSRYDFQLTREQDVSYSGAIDQNREQNIRFSLRGSRLTVYINGIARDTFTVTFKQPAFYFGFRLLEKSDLAAVVSSLVVKPPQ